MARGDQIGLHGMIRAVALGKGVGDDPIVAVGLLRIGLFERDLGAGQQSSERVSRSGAAGSRAFLLRLWKRRYFDACETDFAAVLQRKCATIQDAACRTPGEGLAIAAGRNPRLLLRARAPPIACRRRDASRQSRRHDPLPPAHHRGAKGGITASLRRNGRVRPVFG